ncbi:hypothetical protein G7Z17_g11304 [Cylindrodendrum hubeiense]|uniref:Cyanate lyase C-terminal domain-containing protein n=1 Tax=Cylindrodendrum hubeiense TaxID=595255 RepID=A0A9P5GXC4_9HYPO|nr:hypothetical protein G7Z17_g11304 [Cylindrodendrum hubeiense]
MANEGRIATLDSTIADRLPAYSKSLFDAKAAKGLSFEAIGKHLDRSEVACAALFYGQATASDDDVERLSELLDLHKESLTAQMTGFPNRGQAGPMPPVEPLIYRLYEIVQNYGYAYKAILNEKFGDGIMSAIAFSTKVDKEVDEAANGLLCACLIRRVGRLRNVPLVTVKPGDNEAERGVKNNILTTPIFKMPSTKTNNTKDQTNNYPLGCNVMVKPTTPGYPLGCSVMAKPTKDQNPSYPLGCTIM